MLRNKLDKARNVEWVVIPFQVSQQGFREGGNNRSACKMTEGKTRAAVFSSLVEDISMFRRLRGVLMIGTLMRLMGDYPHALWAKWHD